MAAGAARKSAQKKNQRHGGEKWRWRRNIARLVSAISSGGGVIRDGCGVAVA
jgi:hypothetical protein